MEKYYPSNEKFLYGNVNDVDYYGYIFHGFALVNREGESYYVSYNFSKPMLMIPQTPEADELFRKKSDQGSNISLLVKFLAKLKIIQVHYGDTDKAHELVTAELKKDEYRDTVDDFNDTIKYILSCMFAEL